MRVGHQLIGLFCIETRLVMVSLGGSQSLLCNAAGEAEAVTQAF